MNNSKGFTLAEMMVASLMLIVAIAGAMSFFIFQSSRGADATKLKNARQTVAVALSLMRRDIELSALGTSGTDTLPVFVVPNTNPGTNADRFYVSYDNFLDWTFDINHVSDTNSIFRVFPFQPATGSSFVYTAFPVTMRVDKETRPCGGFVVTPVGGGTAGVDVDWDNTNNNRPVGQQNWTVYLKAGQTVSGTVTPAIVYEIFPAPVGDAVKLNDQPTSELRRNGLRLAGGTYDMDVYNLVIRDRSFQQVGKVLSTGLSYEMIVQYQVRGAKSQGEYTKLGAYSTTPPVNATGKKTWMRGHMRVRAECRRYTSNQRAL